MSSCREERISLSPEMHQHSDSQVDTSCDWLHQELGSVPGCCMAGDSSPSGGTLACMSCCEIPAAEGTDSITCMGVQETKAAPGSRMAGQSVLCLRALGERERERESGGDLSVVWAV